MKGKVFGIGHIKSGTTSLAAALKVLGYNVKDLPLGMVKCRNRKVSLDFRKAAKYDGLTDIPAARFYKELDKKFPGSKFILTVREEERWLDSARRHVFIGKWWKYPNRINQLHQDVLGDIVYNEKKFRKAYHQHHKDVMDYFRNRKNDLLVINICNGEGWEKLCKFLGNEIPDVPFPRSNRGFHRRLNDFMGKQIFRIK